MLVLRVPMCIIHVCMYVGSLLAYLFVRVVGEHDSEVCAQRAAMEIEEARLLLLQSE